jgi:hypothetical protein
VKFPRIFWKRNYFSTGKYHRSSSWSHESLRDGSLWAHCGPRAAVAEGLTGVQPCGHSGGENLTAGGGKEG